MRTQRKNAHDYRSRYFPCPDPPLLSQHYDDGCYGFRRVRTQHARASHKAPERDYDYTSLDYVFFIGSVCIVS